MRLFIGTPAPASDAYQEVTDRLSAAIDGFRPVPKGTWHATLRFLGEVPDDEVDHVTDAMEAAVGGWSPIRTKVQGLGAFPKWTRARVIWAGMHAPGLELVATAVLDATVDMGQPPDDRRFKPHVTLGRLKRPQDVTGSLQERQDRLFAEGLLDRVVLWRSDLGPEGPEYTPIHNTRLDRTATRDPTAKHLPQDVADALDAPGGGA